MKERKREVRFFHIMQYEEEGRYLRRMHNAGWEFELLAMGCIYYFRRCEPEDVVYQLDYNQEGIAHKEEYVRMFEDCGWEYLCDYLGYSYFRKPAAQMTGGEEGIFCDDESRMEMVRRVFKGRLTPLLVIFLGVLLPQLIVQINLGNGWLVVFYALAIAIYAAIFANFAVCYWRYTRQTK